MKCPSPLVVLALVSLALVEPAMADEPPARIAEALVLHAVVAPLAARERDQSRFSRARLPAGERRVRILDDTPRTDASGGRFLSFAVDERHGVHALGDDAGWRLAAVSGCAYVDGGAVFVKSGDRHRPAAFLLGKNLKPAPESTCQGAATAAANARSKE